MWWDFKYCGIKIFGPLVHCLGSGGGGGGGSGAVSYPAYMQTVHNDWLDNTGVDTITSSITDVMDSALGASPWAAQSPYDPDADIAAYEAAVTAFAAILAGMNDVVDWAALFAQSETSLGAAPTLAVADEAVGDMAGVSGITEATIVADVDAFADQLDDEITTKILPRFRQGMRDINAVVSSAFPIGESIIEGFRDRDVAKHNSSIRLMAEGKNADIDLEEGKANLSKNIEVARMNLSKDVEVGRANAQVDVEYGRMYLEGSSQMLRLMLQRISFEDSYVKAYIEAMRIKIVAKKEENNEDMKIDEADALWDLEVFQHGANLLAAIGGGTVGTRKPSTAQSVLGGALSGAAAGAMVGSAVPGVGTAIGAVVGGVLGAASGLL